MRQGKEEVDAIEPHPVDIGGSGEAEHGFQIDRRLESGPLPTSPGHIALCSAG